ncbi:MAG: hypothetical protein FJ098_11460, partial [Deltaproteobacteria bacterium]|nr:hypothetical protein [Deltaproteobacteria bacterium]
LNFGHGWRDTLCQVDQEGMDALDAGDRPSIYLTTECNACELDAPGQPRVACEDYVLRPGGGTAYVGNTEFGVGAPWLMAFYRDLIQRLYASPGVPLGDLVAETLRTFADPAEAAKPLSDLRWTYLVLILMGDPSMMVFTDRPRPLDTDATWEAGTLQVTVRDGAVPVSGATVALSAPGLLHVTVTGPEGVATFAWEEAPPEVSWTLTATAPNHLPAEAALRF